MKTSWTSGLEPERALVVTQDFKGSIPLRLRLEEIINKKIKSSNALVRQRVEYEKASWPYLQADAIGYERALIEIISLISDSHVE